jgi:hypothetical protein
MLMRPARRRTPMAQTAWPRATASGPAPACCRRIVSAVRREGERLWSRRARLRSADLRPRPALEQVVTGAGPACLCDSGGHAGRMAVGQPRGCGTIRMYGFGAFQPPGNFALAASSETDGTMITSSPSCQLTGVAT